ncbi:MAG: N-acetylmuramoyl-L-alanine amidase [Chloroflexia bacterium]|nr:N-acetylmuramoyl-L-alanine amidase [Chloroflexia bacterium]
MFRILPKHRVLYLSPLLAVLFALLGSAPLTVSGAVRDGSIRAETWTETAEERAESAGRAETYYGSYKLQTFDSVRHHTSFEFNAVAARWDATLLENSDVLLFLRTSRDNRGWSPWSTVEPENDAASNTGTNFGNLLIKRGAYMQYRVQLTAPARGKLPDVSSISFTFIDSREGPETRGAASGVAYAAEIGPRVISRTQWGAEEQLRFDGNGRETWGRQYTRPTKAIIHETVTLNHDPNPAATVRAIYYYHAVTRGWGDIGYNFLVDEQGRIYEGRAGGENVVGGHARCFNWGTIGIAALGEYNSARPSLAMIRAIEDILVWKFRANKINPYGHGVLGSYASRDIPNIAAHVDLDGMCGNSHQDPGKNLYSQFPSIRRNVARRLAGVTGTAGPVVDRPAPSAPARGGVKEPSYTVRTGGLGLSLRSKPGMNGQIIAVLGDGIVVQEITSPIDGWVKSVYQGKTGYLWHEYLLERRAAVPPPARRAPGRLRPGASAVIRGTPGALNLRQGPGMESPVVAKMWEGLGVTITGPAQSGWYPVVYTDGSGKELTGWTWGKYLKPGASRGRQAAGTAMLAGTLGIPAWNWRRRRRDQMT